MVVLANYNGTEVPVVPSQDPGIADRSHRHNDWVGQVDSGVDVPVGEFEGEPQFGVGWCVDSVDSIEQGAAERDRRRGVASSAEQQIDLGEDGPWDNHVSCGSSQQLGREPMPSPFAAVQG